MNMNLNLSSLELVSRVPMCQATHHRPALYLGRDNVNEEWDSDSDGRDKLGFV